MLYLLKILKCLPKLISDSKKKKKPTVEPASQALWAYILFINQREGIKQPFTSIWGVWEGCKNGNILTVSLKICMYIQP